MNERNDTPLQPGRRRLMAGASGAAMLGWSALGAAADKPAKMTLAYPTRSGATWPMWIAKRAGLYEKYGIDANLVFGVHPAGVAMLVSGEAQGINSGLDQVIPALVRDPSMVMTHSMLNKGNFALVARGEIGSVKDLKGKRISVGRLGDPPYFYTVELLRKYGLAPNDVQWVSTGTDAASRASMLLGGQVDAGLLTAPSYFKLETQGLKVLTELPDHEDIYVSTAFLHKRGYLAEQRGRAEGLIRAHAEAIKRFYDDKAFAVATFKAFDQPESEADIGRVYDIYVKRNVLDRVPLISRAAIQATVDRLAEQAPAVRKLDLGRVVDNGLVLKLARDGWFEQLFGSAVREEQERKIAGALG